MTEDQDASCLLSFYLTPHAAAASAAAAANILTVAVPGSKVAGSFKLDREHVKSDSVLWGRHAAALQ